jgi:peroxiredoxin
MNENDWRRIAAMATLVMFAGCQAGMRSPAPAAAIKANAARPPVVASDNAKASVQQPTPATNRSSLKAADSEPVEPKARTAFYRADSATAAIPHVLMSKSDEAACKVKVGDAMPAIELPKLSGTGKAKLSDLLGKKATVVVFWKSDRRMAQQELADLGTDVVEPFGGKGAAVVGVAVDESAKDAQATLKKAGADFPNLLDADGKAFARIGNGRFPRTYVLDSTGKIVWFDIEYSSATRRELHRTLRKIVGEK